MVFDDHVTVHAVYTKTFEGRMFAQSVLQAIRFPDTAPTDKLRPQDEILNDTVLSGVAKAVTKYCQPGDLFVTLVHNLNLDLHLPQDMELIAELPALFNCHTEDIVVVHVILGRFHETCTGHAQSLPDFLDHTVSLV